MHELTGEAAHGFITTLIAVAMNAHRIAEWKLDHALDEGEGVLADEWYAMIHLVRSGLEEAMSEWSTQMHPAALAMDGAGRWNIEHDEETDGWVPDSATAVVEMMRATPEEATELVEQLTLKNRESHQISGGFPCLTWDSELQKGNS